MPRMKTGDPKIRAPTSAPRKGRACICEISPPLRTGECRLRQIIGGDFFWTIPAGESKAGGSESTYVQVYSWASVRSPPRGNRLAFERDSRCGLGPLLAFLASAMRSRRRPSTAFGGIGTFRVCPRRSLAGYAENSTGVERTGDAGQGGLLAVATTFVCGVGCPRRQHPGEPTTQRAGRSSPG
jgi:hypothetical protein